MSRRITVRGIIIKNNLLFSVRHRFADGTPKLFWCTPGGGLDPNETLIDGVTRELIEETGVTPKVGRLLLIQQFHLSPPHLYTGNDECIEFFFHIENADDFESIDLSKSSHGEQEIAEYGFIDPHAVDYKPSILNKIDVTGLLNENSPVILTSELT